MLGVQFLDADLRVVAAVGLLRVLARIIVDREGRLRVLGRDVGLGDERGFRLLEVEVVHRVGAGLHFLRQRPASDALGGERAARGAVGHAVVTRIRVVRGAGVGQHQRVLAVLVLEEIIDAFVFHQAADEVEIRLAVLHAVVPGGVRAAQRIPEIREALVAEDLFDDVGHRLALEDAAVRRARQEPQPGHEGRAVAAASAVGRGLHEAADVAVEVARRFAVEQVQADRRVAADHGVEVQVGVFAGEVHVDLEQPAELLGDRGADDQHLVLAQRRVDG